MAALTSSAVLASAASTEKLNAAPPGPLIGPLQVRRSTASETPCAVGPSMGPITPMLSICGVCRSVEAKAKGDMVANRATVNRTAMSAKRFRNIVHPPGLPGSANLTTDLGSREAPPQAISYIATSGQKSQSSQRTPIPVKKPLRLGVSRVSRYNPEHG